MNSTVTRAFIKIKHAINGCFNEKQLHFCRQMIDFHKLKMPLEAQMLDIELAVRHENLTMMSCVCGWAGRSMDRLNRYIPDSGCVTPVSCCPKCSRSNNFTIININ
jgi:hypothetical protein